MTIYADNAATTNLSGPALNAMLPYFGDIYGNPSSFHKEGQKANKALIKAREEIAFVLGCEPKEIIFTSGGTESDNQALISAAEYGKNNGKMHIVSTAFEHHAVLNTLEKLKEIGFEITLINVPENGIITPSQVESAIREETCLVSVMYANNEIGTVQPVKEIGEICRNRGIVFHTDAVQAAGHLHINVKEENIDMLTLSAHKFGGPKGIGALYVRKGINLTSLIYGGPQERGKRAGTENVPAAVGMAAALKESRQMIDINTLRTERMRDRLIEGLSEIPHSILNGDKSERLPGNVNFCFEGIEGEPLLLLLDERGICASSGSACSAGSIEPSHVLLAIGRPPEIAQASLRLTINENNTDEEIEYIIKTVKEVVALLRNMSPAWKDLTEGKRSFYTN